MPKYSRHGISPKLESSYDSSLEGLAVALGSVESGQLLGPELLRVWRQRVSERSHEAGSHGLGKTKEQFSRKEH